MGKVAFLFPGQGSQYVGMAKDIYDARQDVRELYASASDILGYDLADVSFNGPEEKLKETVVTQPAILVHSLGWLLILKDSGIKPDFSAGHSLGEYSALAAAGAFSYQDAVTAVDTRCKAMQEACDLNPGTMAAIIGFDREKTEQLAAKMKEQGVCVPANFNSPGQVVISGEIETVKAAVPVAKEMGAKLAKLLPVGGAFHSPLMEPARDKMKTALKRLTFKSPEFPVIANVTGKPVTDPEEIARLLVAQITSPVLWVDTLQELKSRGVDTFVEIGPGRVLSGLVKRTLKDVAIHNLDRLEDLESVKQKLEAMV